LPDRRRTLLLAALCGSYGSLEAPLNGNPSLKTKIAVLSFAQTCTLPEPRLRDNGLRYNQALGPYSSDSKRPI